ncbi:MAG: MerR family transcriptional regulator [Devosia sp.]
MIAIGEASRRSGVGIETIRYYEREGVVPTPGRGPNGRRLYDDAGVRRLSLLKKCRDLGFSISDAKTIVRLSDETDADCDAIHRISLKQIDNIRCKIAALRKLEAALIELTDRCASGNVECPMVLELAGR